MNPPSPSGPPASDVTRILARAHAGDTQATAELMRLVYDELRRLAAGKLAREAPGHTLQPTALGHEAWLRLGGDAQPTWQNRAHFFGAAAEAMRRILIDRARRRQAARHGGGQQRVTFDGANLAAATDAEDGQLLALDEALGKLETLDAPKARLVQLRYFAGLSVAEAAQACGISEATAKRWWAYARAWLHREIAR